MINLINFKVQFNQIVINDRCSRNFYSIMFRNPNEHGPMLSLFSILTKFSATNTPSHSVNMLKPK